MLVMVSSDVKGRAVFLVRFFNFFFDLLLAYPFGF